MRAQFRRVCAESPHKSPYRRYEVKLHFDDYRVYQDSLSFRQVARCSIQIVPKVLDRLNPYFSGEDSLASNKAGAFLR
jgi:hypothetical protein